MHVKVLTECAQLRMTERQQLTELKYQFTLLGPNLLIHSFWSAIRMLLANCNFWPLF